MRADTGTGTGADACVRGSGAVAMAAALALGRAGLRVHLASRAAADAVDAARPTGDVRAYALNAASVALLRTIKVWDALPADARTPVQDMRIEGDAASGRGGAGTLHLSAWSHGLEALAWIVDAAELEQALRAAVGFAPNVTPADQPDERAPLQVLAEGRASAAREALGVRMPVASYDQLGVAARVVSDQPHAGLARQWFRSPDVLALLPFDRPLAGHGYGVVWSARRSEAEALCQLDDAGFEQALADVTGGAAGRLRVHGPRAAWPLALARAEPVCGPGWVLVGDAAHLVHPLAGQGLNLGLGDVAALAEVLAAREAWRSPGDERLLRRYARRRAAPVAAMAAVTDGLWQLFSRPEPWLRLLRNRGLDLVDRLPPVKRWLAAGAGQG